MSNSDWTSEQQEIIMSHITQMEEMAFEGLFGFPSFSASWKYDFNFVERRALTNMKVLIISNMKMVRKMTMAVIMAN